MLLRLLLCLLAQLLHQRACLCSFQIQENSSRQVAGVMMAVGGATRELVSFEKENRNDDAM
jgi:hypothetical protein